MLQQKQFVTAEFIATDKWTFIWCQLSSAT